MQDENQRSETRDVTTGRRRFLRAAGAVAVASAASTAFVGSASAASVTVPGDYPDLTSAIAAADSDSSITEVVATGGTYDGTVTVDVAGLTVRASDPGAATISGSDGDVDPAVTLAADGVTLAGFEVTNPGSLLGVGVQGGVADATVRENYVHEVGPYDRLGTTGVIAAGDNEGLTVADNEVAAVSSAFDGDESGYPTTNGVFLDNQAGGYEDASVTGNVVRDLSAETAPLGILLQGDLDGVTVAENRVTGLTASNDRSPDEQEGTKFVTYAQGVNVTADSSADVAVRRNVLADISAEYFNGESVKVDAGAGGLVVEQNDLLAPVGIGNATGTEVPAPCNYWGHPQGPREVAGNLVADDGPNRQDRSAYFGPVAVPTWSVRSVENGENVENSCVGGRGGGNGGGPGNGNGPGN